MHRIFFIMSSSEGLVYAQVLGELLDKKLMDKYNIACQLWKSDEVFVNGHSTLEDLERMADKVYSRGKKSKMGYAIVMLTPDDALTINEQKKYTSRDNVIFEFGLFVGKLGRERTFALVPNNIADYRMPTDLSGISLARYSLAKKGESLDTVKKRIIPSVESICTWIDKIENPINTKIEQYSMPENKDEVFNNFEKPLFKVSY